MPALEQIPHLRQCRLGVRVRHPRRAGGENQLGVLAQTREGLHQAEQRHESQRVVRGAATRQLCRPPVRARHDRVQLEQRNAFAGRALSQPSGAQRCARRAAGERGAGIPHSQVLPSGHDLCGRRGPADVRQPGVVGRAARPTGAPQRRRASFAVAGPRVSVPELVLERHPSQADGVDVDTGE